MRIFVDNSGYELHNFGDVAMLQIAVERLAALWPDASIEVLTTAPTILKQFCPQALPLPGAARRAFFEEGALLPGRHPKLRRALNELERHFRRRFPGAARQRIQGARSNAALREQLAQFAQALEGADLCLGSGGGYLTDSFPAHAHATLDTLWMAHRCGVPTALLGQGLGPMNGRALRGSARRTLPLVGLIGLREKLASQELCRALGVAPQRVVVTGDDAIELAYRQRLPDDAPLGRAIGVNVRVAHYSRVDDLMLQSLRSVLDRCAQKWDAPLIGVPISASQDGLDVKSIGTLLNGLANAASDAADRGEDVQSPDDAIAQVGRCRLVVTGSYHAGLFALSQGISVIGLAASDYYVDKFAGLKAQFGAGCHWLPLADADFCSRLEETMNTAWDEAQSVRPLLLDAAKAQIAVGCDFYDQLLKLVADAKLTRK